MPLQDGEKRKEYMKEWRKKNKEYMKKYRLENKERASEYNKKHYQNNIDKKKEYDKKRGDKYRKTDNGKKSILICKWRNRNVICDDFDAVYDRYINTTECEWCEKDITEGKCLEHNHYSGEIRGIVCHSCNLRIYHRKDKKYIDVLNELKLWLWK